ncbi:MAG: hypothetical protein WD069_03490 [Planctomycetales bacterium]
MRRLTVAAVALVAAVWAVSAGEALFRGAAEDLRAQEAERTPPRSREEGRAPATAADPATNRKSAAGSESTGAAATPAGLDAARHLARARDKLVAYSSVRAELLESVSIGERRFKVAGSYLQGPDHKLRLEYRVRLGDTEGTLQEICDGDVLWSVSQIRSVKDGAAETATERPRITRQDVKEIIARVRDLGEARREATVLELGLGGLPALLASISDRVAFDEVREESLDGRPFIVLYGGWDPEFLRVLHGAGNAPLDEKAVAELSARPLPEHVPDRVRLFLDADEFPRRIQYLKRSGGDGPLAPMVTLDLVKVELDVTIDDSEFTYEPPDGVYVNDITAERLEGLKPPAASPRPQRDRAEPSDE